MTRTLPAVLGLLLTAACAAGPSGSTVAPTGPTTFTVNTGAPAARRSVEVVLKADNTVTTRMLDATAGEAWAAAEEVYLSLGIPVTLRDEEQKILGNNRFAPGRRLLDQRLSRFLNCGTDQQGTSIADTYRVTMEVRTQVSATADGRSEIHTTLSGNALPRSGTRITAVNCTSNGLLEQRIGTAFQLKLAGTES